MSTAAAVFGKMKDWSRKTLNSRHRILLNDIATDMSISQELLQELLAELENAGLVKIYRSDVASVSLTSRGLSHESYGTSEEISSS